MFAQCVRCSLPAGEDFAFAEQVRPLRDAAPPSTRWVFATATLPEQVFMDLEEVGGAGASEMVVGVEGVQHGLRVLGKARLSEVWSVCGTWASAALSNSH